MLQDLVPWIGGVELCSVVGCCDGEGVGKFDAEGLCEELGEGVRVEVDAGVGVDTGKGVVWGRFRLVASISGLLSRL